MVKAVIFDLGNVLIRYDHSETMAALAAVSRLPAAGLRELTAEVSTELGVGEMGIHELHRYLVDRAGTTDDFQHFVAAFCAGQSRDDAALAYAVELQRRDQITVAVISNTNEGHVLWLDDHVSELKLFDLVIMSNEVGLIKPDPAIYELALELLNLGPDKAIFIDDSAANVAAARSLGLSGIDHDDWGRTRPLLESWLAPRS